MLFFLNEGRILLSFDTQRIGRYNKKNGGVQSQPHPPRWESLGRYAVERDAGTVVANIAMTSPPTSGYRGTARSQRQWRQWIEWARQPHNQDLIGAVLAGMLLGTTVSLRYHYGPLDLYARATGWYEDSLVLAHWRSRGPKVGQVVQLPEFRTPTGWVHLPEATGYTGLAFAINCPSCASTRHIQVLERMARRFPQLKPYFVVMARDTLPLAWRQKALPVPVVMDFNAEAGKRLNVSFEKQFYLLDPSGRLLYVSRYRQPLEEVERDLAAVLKTEGEKR